MKKEIIYNQEINLTARPIISLTEDLFQKKAEEVLGRLLTNNEMSILHYGGFWSNDVARLLVLEAIEIAIKDVEENK
ncbi:MAG: hypothetical protein HGA36_00905 [Candidatus Moranbacteria bacterium]|nr:hypothetical protein [Candidatus Moranbacteria bacterium]